MVVFLDTAWLIDEINTNLTYMVLQIVLSVYVLNHPVQKVARAHILPRDEIAAVKQMLKSYHRHHTEYYVHTLIAVVLMLAISLAAIGALPLRDEIYSRDYMAICVFAYWLARGTWLLLMWDSINFLKLQIKLERDGRIVS